jgi:hypothetical protein
VGPPYRPVHTWPACTPAGAINPTYIRYLTKAKAYNQIFRRLLFGDRKDRFVQE